jgi:predicted nucleic acid-binding protein
VIVFADTSVLLNVAFLNLERLLAAWFEAVLIPKAVARSLHAWGPAQDDLQD